MNLKFRLELFFIKKKKMIKKLILIVLIIKIKLSIVKSNDEMEKDEYTTKIGSDTFVYKMEEDLHTHLILLYPNLKIACDMKNKNVLLHTIIPKYKYKLIKHEKDKIYDECILPFNMDIYEYAYRNNYKLKIIIDEKEYTENSKIIEMDYIRDIKMGYIYSNLDSIEDTDDIYIPYFKLNKKRIYTNISIISDSKKYIPYEKMENKIYKEFLGNDPDSIFSSFQEFYNLLKILTSFKYDICSETSSITCFQLKLIIIIPFISLVIILILFSILTAFKKNE